MNLTKILRDTCSFSHAEKVLTLYIQKKDARLRLVSSDFADDITWDTLKNATARSSRVTQDYARFKVKRTDSPDSRITWTRSLLLFFFCPPSASTGFFLIAEIAESQRIIKRTMSPLWRMKPSTCRVLTHSIQCRITCGTLSDNEYVTSLLESASTFAYRWSSFPLPSRLPSLRRCGIFSSHSYTAGCVLSVIGSLVDAQITGYRDRPIKIAYARQQFFTQFDNFILFSKK